MKNIINKSKNYLYLKSINCSKVIFFKNLIFLTINNNIKKNYTQNFTTKNKKNNYNILVKTIHKNVTQKNMNNADINDSTGNNIKNELNKLIEDLKINPSFDNRKSHILYLYDYIYKNKLNIRNIIISNDIYNDEDSDNNNCNKLKSNNLLSFITNSFLTIAYELNRIDLTVLNNYKVSNSNFTKNKTNEQIIQTSNLLQLQTKLLETYYLINNDINKELLNEVTNSINDISIIISNNTKIKNLIDFQKLLYNIKANDLFKDNFINVVETIKERIKETTSYYSLNYSINKNMKFLAIDANDYISILGYIKVLKNIDNELILKLIDFLYENSEDYELEYMCSIISFNCWLVEYLTSKFDLKKENEIDNVIDKLKKATLYFYKSRIKNNLIYLDANNNFLIIDSFLRIKYLNTKDCILFLIRSLILNSIIKENRVINDLLFYCTSNDDNQNFNEVNNLNNLDNLKLEYILTQNNIQEINKNFNKYKSSNDIELEVFTINNIIKYFNINPNTRESTLLHINKDDNIHNIEFEKQRNIYIISIFINVYMKCLHQYIFDNIPKFEDAEIIDLLKSLFDFKYLHLSLINKINEYLLNHFSDMNVNLLYEFINFLILFLNSNDKSENLVTNEDNKHTNSNSKFNNYYKAINSTNLVKDSVNIINLIKLHLVKHYNKVNTDIDKSLIMMTLTKMIDKHDFNNTDYVNVYINYFKEFKNKLNELSVYNSIYYFEVLVEYLKFNFMYSFNFFDDCLKSFNLLESFIINSFSETLINEINTKYCTLLIEILLRYSSIIEKLKKGCSIDSNIKINIEKTYNDSLLNISNIYNLAAIKIINNKNINSKKTKLIVLYVFIMNNNISINLYESFLLFVINNLDKFDYYIYNLIEEIIINNKFSKEKKYIENTNFILKTIRVLKANLDINSIRSYIESIDDKLVEKALEELKLNYNDDII